MSKQLYFLTLIILYFLLVYSNTAAQQDIQTLEGRIAFVGRDHNVYTIDLQSDTVYQLTTDATQMRRYEWPTWSPGGQLAYFCCTLPFSNSLGLEAYISSQGVEPGELHYQSDDEVLTYAYWSPRDCIDEDCGGLALLLSRVESNQFGLRIIDRYGGDADIARGAPLYFSWSPDSSRLLLYRNNQAFEVVTLQSGEITSILESPGLIQAPSWSPVDDRLLLGLRGAGNTTNVTILAEDEIVTLASDIQGLVSFNWSPNGNFVAFRTLTRNGYGPLVVLDAVTGERIAFTAAEDVIAFFWSPDSTSIAYITPANAANEFSARYPWNGGEGIFLRQFQRRPQLSWSILQVSEGSTTQYTSFIPTDEMVYMLSYFDQFAQSHRVWSPDSSHIVFSEITAESKMVISVLDVNRADAVPFLISDGKIGIWSYE